MVETPEVCTRGWEWEEVKRERGSMCSLCHRLQSDVPQWCPLPGPPSVLTPVISPCGGRPVGEDSGHQEGGEGSGHEEGGGEFRP